VGPAASVQPQAYHLRVASDQNKCLPKHMIRSPVVFFSRTTTELSSLKKPLFSLTTSRSETQFIMSDSEQEIFTEEDSVELAKSEPLTTQEEDEDYVTGENVLELEDMEGKEEDIELVESEDGSGEIDLEECEAEDAALLAAAEASDVDPDFEPEKEDVEEDDESEPTAECVDHENCIRLAKDCHELLTVRGLVPARAKKDCVAALAEAICDTYSE